MKTPTKASVKQSATIAKDKIKETGSIARAKVEAASTRVGSASKVAGEKVGAGVENYPVAALVGGLALGAVLGALLPKTKKEDELLGEVGSSFNARAREAIEAARDAGKAKLDELGISTDAAGKKVGELIDSAAKVAEVAGSAAVEAVKG